MIAVTIGGAAGAVARWGVVEAIDPSSGWPWAVFLCNIIGSLVLGAVVAWFGDVRTSPVAYAGLAAGFCGAFTTFSSFAVDLATFLRDERVAMALGYLLASFAAGLGAYAAGRRLVGRYALP